MSPQRNHPGPPERGPAARRLELMRALLARKGQGPVRIQPRASEGPPPLSFAQERVWFFDRLVPGSPVFHIPALYRVRGELDRERLRRALAAVQARHEVLRARFEPGPDGRPFLSAASASGELLEDLGVAPGEDWLERARACARRPFDLARGPLLRVAHVQLAPGDHRLVVVIHHAISEVQSLGVLMGDLSRAYAGEPLAPLELQFSDFAAWQRARVGSAEHAADLAWWTEHLSGLTTLQLAPDRARPPVQTFAGSTVTRALPRELAAALRAFARGEGVTLFAAALAAFAALLWRRSGSSDVPIGAPMTDRDRPELEPLIGFFVSTLVLRCDLSGDPSFRALVARCQSLALDAREHRDLPFERLVEALAPERDLSQSPLFQVALLLQNESEQGARVLDLGGGVTLAPEQDPLALHTGTSKFDLSLIVWNRADGGLALSLEYNLGLYDPETAAAVLGHLETLLSGALAAPDAPLRTLGLLGAEERRVLERWNATAAEIAAETPVHELFEAAVDRDPGALAVAEGARCLTYGELDRRANALAHRLRDEGVGPGELVAMGTERHLELVVGILAVLKAGGAYLPLDLSYPAERLAYMLADARARVVLTRAELVARLPEHAGRTLAFDAERVHLDSAPGDSAPGDSAPGDSAPGDSAPGDSAPGDTAPERLERLGRSAGGRDLAYVIYTSGSTGRPKGVELEHRGLCNLLTWHRRFFDVRPADRATHLAGLAFDASVWELWPYLTAGASVHLVPDEVRLAPRRLLAWFAEQRITQSFVPTPLAEAVLKEQAPHDLALEWMLTGGDKLHAPPPAGTPFRLVNHYGPTENTVVATCAEIPAAAAGAADAPAPTIGRPIDNVRVHVVDAGLQPVPVGVPGELLIGGTSLARGYHGRPDLTEEKFVPDPFAGRAGERLYRTGDLVKFGRDGQLEFLGRLDGQVKIRGFRVELGEIESVLGRHPAVVECAVAVLPDARGDGQLAAYVVGAEGIQPGELRAHLAACLPDYMVPAAVVFLAALPLTPNGKVDRGALPRPGPEAFAADVPHAEPEGELEERIAAVWCALLGRERVGANTNFFELGGHSLLLAQVQVKLSEALAPGLSVIELFQYPTVRSLARHLAAGGGEDDAGLQASRERAEARRSRLRARRTPTEQS